MAKPQSPPSRHHYIPQFYLRRWTGADFLLERYTRPIPSKLEIKRVPTKAVGWWKDLYRAPENDPHKDQYLEQFFFRDLDDRTSHVLARLNETPIPSLSAYETSIWSTYLMSVMHRTPEGLAAYKETAGRIYDETVPEVREHYAELRGPNDPETVEEYEASLTAVDKDRSLMRNFASTIMNPNIGRFLNRLHWVTIDPPEHCHDLLLSDDPLVRTNGLKKDDGHIAIAVSPRRLAVGAYKAEFHNEIRRMKPDALVARVNTLTVEGARHFVVSRDRRQTRFIENHFGLDPRPGLARSSC